MGFFSAIGQFLSNVVTRAYTVVTGFIKSAWTKWVKPAISKVAGWLGIGGETIEHATNAIEAAARQADAVLQASIAQLVANAIAGAKQLFARWSARYLGQWASVLLNGAQQIFATTGRRKLQTREQASRQTIDIN